MLIKPWWIVHVHTNMASSWVPSEFFTHMHNWVGGEDKINSTKWAGRETLYADKHQGCERCACTSELVSEWGRVWDKLINTASRCVTESEIKCKIPGNVSKIEAALWSRSQWWWHILIYLFSSQGPLANGLSARFD